MAIAVTKVTRNSDGKPGRAFQLSIDFATADATSLLVAMLFQRQVAFTFGDWIVLYLDAEGTAQCDLGTQAMLLTRWTVTP
jgi:hypothetical protein